MANTLVSKSYDKKYGGQEFTPIDQATLNAQVAEVIALAHSHANKALLDSYDQTNADIADAIAKKHDPVTIAAGSPFELTGQELDFLFNGTYFKITSGELDAVTGALFPGTNSNGWAVTGTGKILGGDLNINLPQRIDTAATVRFENISVGGAYDASYKSKTYGDANITGALWVDGNVTIGGNLTVAGDSVTFEVGTLVVEDKNIEIAKIGTPTDTYANGGGITLKGTTDKTIIWDSTNSNWTSSEHFNLATGKSYKVNNNVVIDNNRYGHLVKVNINDPGTTAEALNVNGSGKFWGDIYSDNSSVIEPYAGYYIGRTGSVFGKINASEMHVKNFITDLELVFVGGQRVTKSAAILAADLTITAGTGTLTVEKIKGYTGHVFVNGDFVGIKEQTRGASSMTVAYIWGTVVFVSEDTNAGTQTYTITKLAGSGTSASKGSTALDYGTAGNGIIEMVAIDETSNLPTFRVATFATNPWTDLTVKLQAGALSGITTDLWGALSGFGFYSNLAYLEDDVYIGDTAVIGGRSVGMLNGMTNLFHFDGNLYDSLGNAKPAYTGTYAETSYGLITATGLIATKQPGKFGGGVAVEEATTNLSTGVMTNWTPTNATITADTDNFYFLNETAVTGTHIAVRSFSASSGSTYTGSIYVKASKGRRYVTLAFSTYGNWTGSGGGETTFDLWNGTISAHNNPLDKGIESLGSQTYRLWITAASSATFTSNFVVTLKSDASTTSYLGVVGNGILFKWAQVEAKAYRTSYVEGSRAYGSLRFANDIQTNKTYQFWFKYNADYSANTVLWYSNSGTSQRFGVGIGTDMQIFVYANGFYTTGLYFNNFGGADLKGRWILCTLIIDGTNYKYYFNNTLIDTRAHGGVLPTALIYLGSASASSETSVYYDEYAAYNRALAAKEIEQIYRSNQPFNESAGLTVINGNQIKTGIMQSENWVSQSAGSMFDLNKGYLEMNYNGARRFYFDSSTGNAQISTFGFTDKLFTNATYGITLGDYTGVTITEGIYLGNRTVTGVNYRELLLYQDSNRYLQHANTGTRIYTIYNNSDFRLQLGDITSDSSNHFGIYAANLTGTEKYFKLTNSEKFIAAFDFDATELSLSKNIGGTDYKIIRFGDLTPSYSDIYTNQTSNFDDIIFEDGTKDNWGAAYGDAYWTIQSKWDTSSNWTGYGSSNYALQLQELTTSDSGLLYYYNNFDSGTLTPLQGRYIRISYSFRQKAISAGTSARDIVVEFYLSGSQPTAAKTHLRTSFTSNVTLSDSISLFVPSGTTSITARVWYSHLSHASGTGTFWGVQFSGFKIERLEAMQVVINADGFEAYGGPDNRVKLSGAGSIFKVPLLEAVTLKIGAWEIYNNPSESGSVPRNALLFRNTETGTQKYIHPSTGAWT
jgi:hypothetical protein